MYKSLIIFLLFVNGTQAQTLAFKAGLTGSKIAVGVDDLTGNSYDAHHILDLLYENKRMACFGSVGINYVKKKHYYLNSNLSLIDIGSKGRYFKEIDGIYLPYNISTRLYFLSLNTIFKGKIKMKKEGSFFEYGIGPRIDFLIDIEQKYNVATNTKMDFLAGYPRTFNENQSIQSYSNNGLNKCLFGLQGVLGINRRINNVEVGFECSFNYNFNKLVNSEINLNISPYPINYRVRMYVGYITIGMTFGLNLKKD